MVSPYSSSVEVCEDMSKTSKKLRLNQLLQLNLEKMFYTFW